MKKIIASAAALATTAGAAEYPVNDQNTISIEEAVAFEETGYAACQNSFWDDVGDFFGDIWDKITNPPPLPPGAEEVIDTIVDWIM